jgi:hypothetical protein
MGIYLPQGHVSTFVSIDVDGATLQALGCAKTPEILFRDLVERCDGIADVVFDRGSQANGTNVPAEHQLQRRERRCERPRRAAARRSS